MFPRQQMTSESYFRRRFRFCRVTWLKCPSWSASIPYPTKWRDGQTEPAEVSCQPKVSLPKVFVDGCVRCRKWSVPVSNVTYKAGPCRYFAATRAQVPFPVVFVYSPGFEATQGAVLDRVSRSSRVDLNCKYTKPLTYYNGL